MQKFLQNLLGENRFYSIGYLYLLATQNHFRESVYTLNKFRNIHQGKRCFIIGNGPSLRTMDLSKLRHEFTFGLNRFYLMYPELGFSTSYHVAVNKLVVKQFGNEILEKVTCPKFVSYDARHWITPNLNTVFLYSRDGPRFFKDISRGIWQGATVTYVALQIAYHLGFTEVILIGVDHSFKVKGTPHEIVTSDSNDTNHFDPNYFGKGVEWQLPDLETSELAYQLAKQKYSEDNRQIIDATVDGKLQVFPKVTYKTLF